MKNILILSLLSLASASCDSGAIVSVAQAAGGLSCSFYCAKKHPDTTINGVFYPGCLSPDDRFPPLETATFTDGRMDCPTDQERGSVCDACRKIDEAQKSWDEAVLRAAVAAAKAAPQPGLYINPVAKTLVIYDQAGLLWTVPVAPDLVSNPVTLLPTLTKVVQVP